MIWALPSAIALIIKSFLFFYSDVRQKKYFFFFLVATFLLNLCEMLLFVRLGHDLAVLKLYYCSAAFTLFYLVLTCSDISNSFHWIKSDLSLLAVGTLTASIFFGDSILLGSQPLPNGTLTRIPGAYYFVFQLYTIAALVLSVGLLTRRLILQNDYQLKAQCLIALLAFTPSIAVIFTIMILMHLNHSVNMVGFLSMSLCFMVMLFISLNDKHKLFTMMSFVPFSRERAYRLELKQLLKQLHNPMYGQPVQIKVLLQELELLIINNTQHYFSTQKELAQMLNISEGNLSRKKLDYNKTTKK